MHKNSNSTTTNGSWAAASLGIMLLGRVHLAGFPGSQHSFKLNLKNVFYASNTELNYKRVTRTHWWWWKGRWKLREPPTSCEDSLVWWKDRWKPGNRPMSRRDSLVVVEGRWKPRKPPTSRKDSLVVVKGQMEV